MSLLQDFQSNWQQKKFSGTDDQILLAVSGGVDSMVMAQLFIDAGISFGVAHCNYGLRAEASDLDEQLVLDWCLGRKIVCYAHCFATKKIAEAAKKSIQEAARDIRYGYVNEICDEYGFTKIATAHHLADNAETVLMRILKGTGLTGLKGIPEVNGRVIRPLLFARKKSILAYAANRQVPFRNDASNDGDAYLRNRIRHHIMPAVEKEFPEAVWHLDQLAKRAEEITSIYKAALQKELKKLLDKRGEDYYIPLRLLLKKKEKSTLLYEMLQPFGFTPAQLPDALHLLTAESGRRISSASYHLIRNRDFLILTQQETTETEIILLESFPATIDTKHGRFEFSLVDRPAEFPQGNNAAFLDADQLQAPVILRHWKTGDYFYPLGMNNKKKKLSRFFIDQKVAVHEKEKIWLLESNKRIAWVAGYRADERFKLKAGTGQTLRVVFIPVQNS